MDAAIISRPSARDFLQKITSAPGKVQGHHRNQAGLDLARPRVDGAARAEQARRKRETQQELGRRSGVDPWYIL